MNIEELYKVFQRVPFITTDTRKIVKDSIFLAIRGEKFNGNRFAADALDKGATFAIVDDPSITKDREKYILVDNTIKALQDLATYHRSKLKTDIIAITGSNGKTTTKELIYRVLSQKYKTAATQGNLNNHIGVPLTILNFYHEHQIGIVELGANHVGEISNLCRIAQPGYGIITNIGKAHLEGFRSIEGVRKAKGELYEYLNSTHGNVFVNAGNKMLLEMLTGFSGEIIRYGNETGTLCKGKINISYPYLSLRVGLVKPLVRQMDVHTNIVGDYNLENILAAICIGVYFGVDPDMIVHAISDYFPDLLRSQMITTRYNTIVVDAYNANPTSMEAAVRNFSSNPSKNKLFILGEMMELGDSSEGEHLSLVNILIELKARQVLLVGESFYKCAVPERFLRFRKTGELEKWLLSNPVRNATILLKGSRAVELEKIIPCL